MLKRRAASAGFFSQIWDNKIDLIIEGPRKEIVAIEIKARETIKSDHFKSIKQFAKDHSKRFKRGIVLYRGESPLAFGSNLFALPIQSLWSF